MASGTGDRLTLLHLMEYAPPWYSDADATPLSLLVSISKQRFGLTAPLHIAYGSVGAAVRKPPRDLQADILIIGRGHVQEPLGHLRTSSYSIIRESRCPVISV